MGGRLHPRTFGRVRISGYLLDDADHRPWVRKFFSLGAVPLRLDDNLACNYIEYMLDYDKFPTVEVGKIIPLYEVVVSTQADNDEVEFEFKQVDESDFLNFYGKELLSFRVKPLRGGPSPGEENNLDDAGPGEREPLPAGTPSPHEEVES